MTRLRIPEPVLDLRPVSCGDVGVKTQPGPDELHLTKKFTCRWDALLTHWSR
jgi:hypothetical protein